MLTDNDYSPSIPVVMDTKPLHRTKAHASTVNRTRESKHKKQSDVLINFFYTCCLFREKVRPKNCVCFLDLRGDGEFE